MEQQSRAKFSSNFGFLMAAVGSAVGLGNIWGFPYKMGSNGGFLFILVYLVLMVTVGFAVMLGEFAIGRSTMRSPVAAYGALPGKWTFLGWMGVTAGAIILAFYCVLGGWVLKYGVNFALEVVGVNAFGTGTSGEYFSNFVGSVEPVIWLALFMAATATIVMSGIEKGIEKFSKIMMPALFCILVVIIIRSVTLPGAGKGLEFMLKPNFEVFNEAGLFQVASVALSQMFFSLSLGMGAMITYGSYLDKKENLERNAILIPLMDSSVALMAGFAVIPAAFALGGEGAQLAGPGLMFITLRDVFFSMGGLLGKFMGFIFFVLVFFAAITSSISLLEVASSYLIDSKKWDRKKAVLLMAAIIFLVGSIPVALSQGPVLNWLRIPCPIGKVLDTGTFAGLVTVDLFDLFDWVGEYVFMTLGACMMSIYVGWIWKPENAIKEIEYGGHEFKLKGYWSFLIKWVCPPVAFILFLQSAGVLTFFQQMS